MPHKAARSPAAIRMAMQSALNPFLGTLAVFPREIRDKIYAYTLYLNPYGSLTDAEEASGTYYHGGLILASHQLYNEAYSYLYATNEFIVLVDDTFPGKPFRVDPLTCSLYIRRNIRSVEIKPVRRDLLRYIRKLSLQISMKDFASDVYRVSTWENQRQKEALNLVRLIDESFEILKACTSLKKLEITASSYSRADKWMLLIFDKILAVAAEGTVPRDVDVRVGFSHGFYTMLVSSDQGKKFIQEAFKSRQHLTVKDMKDLKLWQKFDGGPQEQDNDSEEESDGGAFEDLFAGL